ncbi:hypothetical protein K458DRAFT_381549 [Lentithecium fluviatile CBS 122367]|uniref:Nudix hydrolase domain-containing protein n=1 Tax=Lentithecium fluviatile CBS 122367 TaxID=1168545 RepID=A0A6G1JMJ2_9PLEO|nr:hypothetical protein K458DRAFT_381549 [Lentithecium fluviatile CBS 122367]
MVPSKLPKSFTLGGFQDPVEYDPKHPFHDEPYTLRSIEIQSADWFGKDKLGFVKLKAVIRNSKPKSDLPGIAFLRGGSVAMLMILRPKDSRDKRWVVMMERPPVPAGSLAFWEIPLGMVDKSGTFTGAAAKEIHEETGLKIPAGELIDLTALALQDSRRLESKSLQQAMYPSPGGSDEFIPIFYGRRKELITLRVCDYEDLWREGARDAKTLAAWALYEGLNRSGVIQEELVHRRKTHRSQPSQNEPDGTV